MGHASKSGEVEAFLEPRTPDLGSSQRVSIGYGQLTCPYHRELYRAVHPRVVPSTLMKPSNIGPIHKLA